MTVDPITFLNMQPLRCSPLLYTSSSLKVASFFWILYLITSHTLLPHWFPFVPFNPYLLFSICPVTRVIPTSTLCPLSLGGNYSKSAPKWVPIILNPTHLKFHWTFLLTELCSLDLRILFSQWHHYSPFFPAGNLILFPVSCLFFRVQAGTNFFPFSPPASYCTEFRMIQDPYL